MPTRFFIFTFLLIHFCIYPARLIAQADGRERGSAEFQDQMEAAPVRLDGVELFRVRGIKSYPATRRAKEIRSRIVEVANDPNISPDAIVSEKMDGMIRVTADSKHILNIFEADAKLEDVELQTLASVIIRVLRDSIVKYREDRRPENVRQGIVYAVVASAIFIAAFLILQWLYGKFKRKLKQKQDKVREKKISVRSLELIESNRFWKWIGSLFGGLHFVAILALIYAYFELLLAQFPSTRFLSAHLLSLVVDPLQSIGEAIVDYFPNLIFLFILVLVVTVFLKFVRSFFESIEHGTFAISGFEAEWARPTYRILRLLIVAFSLVVAYPYIPGSDSDAFKGVSIFVGVLFSLGSSSAIANVIAGYSLIYRRAFRIGDRIQVGDITGDVTEMRLQVTHLRTIKNEEVTIPNSLILNSHVINYSAMAKTQGLILHTAVGIGYETPWRQVEAMLIRAAERTPNLLKQPPPFVLQKELGDFAVSYEINAYCADSHSLALIYTELHRNILDEFNEYGVQIMTPSYESDPEAPKIVPKEQWFAAPTLRKSP